MLFFIISNSKLNQNSSITAWVNRIPIKINGYELLVTDQRAYPKLEEIPLNKFLWQGTLLSCVIMMGIYVESFDIFEYDVTLEW